MIEERKKNHIDICLNKDIEFKKLPDFMQAIIEEGGVIEYIKKKGDI